MSVPNPSTTDWVPLQGTAGMPGLTYWGQYSAAKTYNDGDLVIGSDGVLYMCVTNGTTTAPTAWSGSGSTGPVGPMGPVGTGVPMPVVNGQWIKGSGGVAIWSPIYPADITSGALVAADSGWHVVGAAGEPSYLNGYSNYGSFVPSRFRKLATNQVELQGMIRPGTAGAPIFVLPVGYRPSSTILVIAAGGEPSGSGRFDARIDIQPSGNVVPDSRNNQTWVSIQTTFFAEA